MLTTHKIASSDRTTTVANEFTRAHCGARSDQSARCPEESAVAGLYALNRAIVMSALDHAADDDGKAAAAIGTIGRLSERLAQGGLSNARLAAYTGDLFSAVVERTGRNDVLAMVVATNERLYEFRVVESQRVANTASELRDICELLLDEYTDKNREKLREAIAAYHDRRRRLVRELCGTSAPQ